VITPFRRLAPATLLAAGACATKGDIRILQNDLQVMRVESAQADSTRKRQLDLVIAALGVSRDSILVISKRLAKFQGDAAGELYALNQQLIQVQELTGQSQRRLQELRASMEERAQQLATPPAPVVGTAPDASSTAGSTATPGPNQLFQLALDQLRRGSTGAARLGFADLLKQYPTADIAPDAQFYVAESYAQEGNQAAADSAYALVVSQFPKSPRAPTALYKRARILQTAGNTAAARAALNQVIRDYPRSDEAALAREQLRTLK
jgi:tol-pal system protein YbgF